MPASGTRLLLPSQHALEKKSPSRCNIPPPMRPSRGTPWPPQRPATRPPSLRSAQIRPTQAKGSSRLSHTRAQRTPEPRLGSPPQKPTLTSTHLPPHNLAGLMIALSAIFFVEASGFACSGLSADVLIGSLSDGRAWGVWVSDACVSSMVRRSESRILLMEDGRWKGRRLMRCGGFSAPIDESVGPLFAARERGISDDKSPAATTAHDAGVRACYSEALLLV